MNLDFLGKLATPAETKMILLVLDGVGGLPREPGGPTALEAAETPNLDRLAKEGICGLHEPVGPGVTPGSGPGHLALFGYDPVEYHVGRGILAALGIGFALQSGDVAARGNFCTVDETGAVLDRRAGRISTAESGRLCELLRDIELSGGGDLFVEPLRDHRFLLLLRGGGLSPDIADTDPGKTGVPPRPAAARGSAAREAAERADQFVKEAAKRLAGQRANMVLLRGFSSLPDFPKLTDLFHIRAAALACYPMYRGAARLVGMEILKSGGCIREQITVAGSRWDDFDFFYLHMKPIDSAGEDADFGEKVRIIEEADASLPELTALKPNVVVVTGDHSTPASLGAHSWHPVPALVWSDICRPDPVHHFTENACLSGALGARFPATDLMPIALANASRLEKYD